jgi:hypothetical protein
MNYEKMLACITSCLLGVAAGVFVMFIVLPPKQKLAPREEAGGELYEQRVGYVQPIGKGQVHFMETRQGRIVYGVWILTDSANNPTDITVLHLYTEYNNTTWQDTLTRTRE